MAFVRIWLSGVFNRYQKLSVLVAHTGEAAPFRAGRVQCCVEHETQFCDEEGKQLERREIWDVLEHNVSLSAVTYSERRVESAIGAVGEGREKYFYDAWL